MQKNKHNGSDGDKITILCDLVRHDQGMRGVVKIKLQSLQGFLPICPSGILRGPLHSLGRSIRSRLSGNVGIGGSQRRRVTVLLLIPVDCMGVITCSGGEGVRWRCFERLGR